MKQILLIATVLVTQLANAQKMTKDSLINLISIDACKEFDKKDFTKVKKENMQMELGMTMLPAISKYVNEIQDIYGGSLTDRGVGEKVGTDIAMKLMVSCPKFTDIAMTAGMEQASTAEKPAGGKTKSERNTAAGESIQGTLTAVTPGDITTLTVRDAKGKLQKLYWLGYYDNADQIKSNPRKYLNKRVRISYTEQDAYDAVKKDYKVIKVITAVE